MGPAAFGSLLCAINPWLTFPVSGLEDRGMSQPEPRRRQKPTWRRIETTAGEKRQSEDGTISGRLP